MALLLQTDIPTIMDQVVVQLLNFVSVSTNVPSIGHATNVYWVLADEQPPPGQTGERDVLLVEWDDQYVNFVGDARFGQITSGMDIYVRTSNASDYHYTQRQWKVQNRTMINAIMDAMNGFFPVDEDLNSFTIYGFNPTTTSKPSRLRDVETWGQAVLAYQFDYLPIVDTSLLTT